MIFLFSFHAFIPVLHFCFHLKISSDIILEIPIFFKTDAKPQPDCLTVFAFFFTIRETETKSLQNIFERQILL